MLNADLWKRINQSVCSLALVGGLIVTGANWGYGDEKSAESAATVATEKPAGAVVDEAALRELAARLDAPDFEERASATQRLIEAGKSAIPILVEAAGQRSLESAVRAVTALEEIYVSSDPETAGDVVDAAEVAIESLRSLPNASVASRADSALERNYVIRQQRALAEISQHGGSVRNMNAPKGNVLDANDPDLFLTGGAYIQLDRSWTGGDDGLKHVRRLDKLRQLYVVKGCKVTEDGLADLQRAIPDLQVQFRGAACLGISGGSARVGCQVINVKEGSAAAKARLQPGDMIYTFGGKPTKDFETLVELIGNYEPSDKVKVELIRNGRPLTLEVELGEWE